MSADRSGSRTGWIEKALWSIHSYNYDDVLEVSRTQIEAAITMLSDHLAPGAIALDLGCGTGNYSLALARRGVSVTGVDVAKGMLRRARTKAEHEGLVLDLREHDIHRGLPMTDASFDIAIGVHVLQVIRPPDLLFREFARLVRPAGAILIGIESVGERVAVTQLTSRLPSRVFWLTKRVVASRSDRVRLVTKEQVIALAAANGFELRDQTTIRRTTLMMFNRAV